MVTGSGPGVVGGRASSRLGVMRPPWGSFQAAYRRAPAVVKPRRWQKTLTQLSDLTISAPASLSPNLGPDRGWYVARISWLVPPSPGRRGAAAGAGGVGAEGHLRCPCRPGCRARRRVVLPARGTGDPGGGNARGACGTAVLPLVLRPGEGLGGRPDGPAAPELGGADGAAAGRCVRA